MFILTVAVVLVIWLALLLSAALTSIGQLPGLAVETASAATSLSCATPVCGPTATQDFEYAAPANSWAVVGVRSGNGLGNVDVCLYGDAGLTQQFACSQASGNTLVDFVVVDYHHTPGGTDYVRSQRVSGSGDVCTTFDCAATTLTANGSPVTTSWTANTVVRAFNLVVPSAGTYRVGVALTSGTADVGLAVFHSAGQAGYAAGRSAAIASADARGGGQGEGLYFTAPGADTLGLVIWSSTPGGTANYRVEFRGAKVLAANTTYNEGGTAAADFLHVPTGPRGWSVLALKPGAGNPPPDADLKVYTRPDYLTQLVRSSAEAGIVDFCVAQYANVPEDTAAVLMVSLGPIGGYKLEWTYDMPELLPGAVTPVSVGGRIGLAWRAQLVAGIEYLGTFSPTAGTRGDAAVSIYGPKTSQPLFTYGTRADSLAGSDVWAESVTGWVADQGVETFAYTPQLSGEFLVYLYQKGSQAVTGSILLEAPALVGVGGEGGGAAFAAPRPSPARPGEAVRFAFDVPTAGPARLSIVDARGRLVRLVVAGTLPAGPSTATWDGRTAAGAPAASGLYFARLERPGLAPAVRRFVRLD